MVLWLIGFTACPVATPPRDASPDSEPPVDCHSEPEPEVAVLCHDGCDNDLDATVDCEDEDCALYCCEIFGVESLACDDRCDNDLDGLFDCEDPACADTSECLASRPESACPEGSDRCCLNGVDDDGDGDVDCADRDCEHTDHCCPLTDSFVEAPDGGFDEAYWQTFGDGAGPTFGPEDWVVSWGELSGVSSREPVDLSYGLRLELTVRVSEVERCADGHDCPAFAALSLGPAPGTGDAPLINLELLVTSAGQVLVRQGEIDRHRVGLGDPSAPARVQLDLIPAAIDGAVGSVVELRVEGGREVCHGDGSSLGCPLEPSWRSEGLLLFDGDNRLLDGRRGSHVSIFGRGAGVEVSDADGQTAAVALRSCENPAVWAASDEADRVDSAVLCWAVGALGSPSVAPLPGGGFAMALEGTTRAPVAGEYGENNFSLGWLVAGDEPLGWRDPAPEAAGVRAPIDTAFDLNCMGPLEWEGERCQAVPSHPEAPAEGCAEVTSRRAPHLVPSERGEHLLLFESSPPGEDRSLVLGAARFSPATWSWRLEPHSLDHVQASMRLGRSYRALRQPAALCASLEAGGSCADGRSLVLAVAEEVDAVGGWRGDDLIALGYDGLSGFEPGAVALLRHDDEEGNPLAGLELAEPWLLYDGPRQRLMLWLLVSEPGEPRRLELLTAACPDCAGAVDVIEALGGLDWRRWPGGPLLDEDRLEQLLVSDGEPLVDCSGRCELGGVSLLPLPEGDGERLHLWLELVERPDDGAPRRWSVVHLWQPSVGLSSPVSE